MFLKRKKKKNKYYELLTILNSISFAPALNCKNNKAYGTCLQCGKCGRKFYANVFVNRNKLLDKEW